MNILNVEFKAMVEDISPYEEKLKELGPRFIGTDHQVDTYFNVNCGRLKLREGNIEHALIHYERADAAGAKSSDVILYRHQPDQALKNILILHFGVKTVVDKIRRIYFIDNVKFHFDRVEGLGEFLEVEAIDDKGAFRREQLKALCDHYFAYFNLHETQMVDRSYSDLLETTRG